VSLAQDLQLTEVMEPPPVDPFPMAIGWWILLLLLLALTFVLIRWGSKTYKRRKMQRIACDALTQKWQDHQQDARFDSFIQTTNLVLKQHCLQMGQAQVAAMTSERWQQYLTQHLSVKHHDNIRQFCHQLYSPVTTDAQSAEALYQQALLWIRGLKC